MLETLRKEVVSGCSCRDFGPSSGSVVWRSFIYDTTLGLHYSLPSSTSQQQLGLTFLLSSLPPVPYLGFHLFHYLWCIYFISSF